jgi:tol-pal system protein YbgF
MHITNKCIPVAFLFVLAGCASKGDVDVMQHDLDELKTRYFNMEKDFSGLKNETKQGMDVTLKENQKEIESLRKETADLQASLDNAKVDMQVMAGKVDEASLQGKKPVEDISMFKEDLDRRLTTLETRVNSLEDQQKKSTDGLTKPSELSPEAMYQQGVDAQKSGNPQKARELLTKFVEQNPKNDLAANAHYWTGESYYSEKAYDQAVLEYEKVIKNYPGKEKVPAAMLKQALAFKALGDKKSAKYVLNKLIESYPRTAEAASAKKNLKQMR